MERRGYEVERMSGERKGEGRTIGVRGEMQKSGNFYTWSSFTLILEELVEP